MKYNLGVPEERYLKFSFMQFNFQQHINIQALSPETDFEEKIIAFLEEFSNNSKTVPVQTSGSTGVPKIFEVEKEKMLVSAKMTCDFLNLKSGNSALLCLPVEYISGKMMMVRSIERKLKLIIKTPSAKPLEDLNEKIDFCAMTPLQVENSLDKIHLIKNLIIGGASVSENLKKKIQETRQKNQLSIINHQSSFIYETYGMSETLSHIALKQIYPKEEDFFNVFQGVKISLDERGCLNISAPNISSSIIKTNDLVELNTEKEFRFLGRIDNVINSGGAKIFPEELEALVKKEISNELVFLGISDEVLGQKLVLIIEGENNKLINHQLSSINYPLSFHRPKEIIFVDKIPRTENGKVNRSELLNLLNR